MRMLCAREVRIATAILCAVLAAAAPAVAVQPPEANPLPSESAEMETVGSHERTRVPDPHDPTRAMHPIRVAAYALHPVGVAIDWLLVRPAVWVARQQPFRAIFGYED